FRGRDRRGRSPSGGRPECWGEFDRSLPLLGPQGFDGVELGGFGRRISTKEQPHAQGYRQAAENGPQLDGAWKRGNPGNNLGGEHPKKNADGAADDGNGGGFDQELHQDVVATCADSFAHADLAGTLGDRDEHYVHDDDATDNKGNG